MPYVTYGHLLVGSGLDDESGLAYIDGSFSSDNLIYGYELGY